MFRIQFELKFKPACLDLYLLILIIELELELEPQLKLNCLAPQNAGSSSKILEAEVQVVIIRALNHTLAVLRFV